MRRSRALSAWPRLRHGPSTEVEFGCEFGELLHLDRVRALECAADRLGDCRSGIASRTWSGDRRRRELRAGRQSEVRERARQLPGRIVAARLLLEEEHLLAREDAKERPQLLGVQALEELPDCVALVP